MKLAQAPQDVKVNGTFETTEFAVGDINFIVDMFADKVYTKKERAVIRELSCNAHDSQVMAGTTDVPFDVHLPTQLESWFSIRDYGTGLSDEEVRTIFSGIGISTKRNSNDVIGCFGIGSLSPFSVSDSFTVTSYHNGTVNVYNCYRDETRRPVVALLTSSDTDQPNGLEINISVEPKSTYHGGNNWEQEAISVFRHWSVTTPNINSDYVNTELKDNRSYMVETDYYGFTGGYGSMYAVMGNIAYEIDDDMLPHNFRGFDGYVKFELGDLSFDTARENLDDTDGNKAAINDRLSDIHHDLVDDIHQMILSQPSDWDRAVFVERLSFRFCTIINTCKDKDWSLNDYKLPVADGEGNLIYYSQYGKGTGGRLDLSKNVRYFLDKRGYIARVKKAAKESRSTMYVMTQEQIDFYGVPSHLVEDLEVLPKVYRASSGSGGNATKAKVFAYDENAGRYSDNQDFWIEEEVDLTKEVVFVEIRNWRPECSETYPNEGSRMLRVTGNRQIKDNYLKACRELGIDEPQVVGLKSAFCRSKAFKNGNFIRLEDWLMREIKRITPDGFSVPDYDKSDFDMIKLIASTMDQEEVQEIVDSVVKPDGVDLLRVYQYFKLPVEKCHKTRDLINNFLDKYPMLKYTIVHMIDNSECQQAIASYINATFKEDNHNG